MSVKAILHQVSCEENTLKDILGIAAFHVSRKYIRAKITQYIIQCPESLSSHYSRKQG